MSEASTLGLAADLNSGETALFNRLANARQQVGKYASMPV